MPYTTGKDTTHPTAQHSTERRTQTVYVLFSCDAWESPVSMRFVGVYDTPEKLKNRVAARIKGEYFEFDSGIEGPDEQRAAFLAAWSRAETQEEKLDLFDRVKYCHVTVAAMNDEDD